MLSFSLTPWRPPLFYASLFSTIEKFGYDALYQATPNIIGNPSMTIHLGPYANSLAIWFIVIVHIPAEILYRHTLTQHLVQR